MELSKIELSRTEYKNLSTKIQGGYTPVDYFRKNLFNADSRSSSELKRKKIIYEDDEHLIKVGRSLHQRHRDLLSLLMYEQSSKADIDGSYYIKTSLYQLSKAMGYKNVSDGTSAVKSLFEDMRLTPIVKHDKIKNTENGHMLLGDYYHDKEIGSYIIKVPAKTSQYIIQSTCVEIPEEINQEIVRIPNKYSKIKALVSFLLANEKLKNGIFFNTICEKLNISNASTKSRFKKQVHENIKRLADFNIVFSEDKFYLTKQIVRFERGVSCEEIDKHLFKSFVEELQVKYSYKTLCTIDNTQYSFVDGKIHFLKGVMSYNNVYEQLNALESNDLLKKLYFKIIPLSEPCGLFD